MMLNTFDVQQVQIIFCMFKYYVDSICYVYVIYYVLCKYYIWYKYYVQIQIYYFYILLLRRCLNSK